MNNKEITKLLEMVQRGELSIEDAGEKISTHLDFGDVKPDISRGGERLGFDEVIYGRGVRLSTRS